MQRLKNFSKYPQQKGERQQKGLRYGYCMAPHHFKKGETKHTKVRNIRKSFEGSSQFSFLFDQINLSSRIYSYSGWNKIESCRYMCTRVSFVEPLPMPLKVNIKFTCSFKINPCFELRLLQCLFLLLFANNSVFPYLYT